MQILQLRALKYKQRNA